VTRETHIEKFQRLYRGEKSIFFNSPSSKTEYLLINLKILISYSHLAPEKTGFFYGDFSFSNRFHQEK